MKNSLIFIVPKPGELQTPVGLGRGHLRMDYKGENDHEVELLSAFYHCNEYLK